MDCGDSTKDLLTHRLTWFNSIYRFLEKILYDVYMNRISKLPDGSCTFQSSDNNQHANLGQRFQMTTFQIARERLLFYNPQSKI
jgi:hypothetical protein